MPSQRACSAWTPARNEHCSALGCTMLPSSTVISSNLDPFSLNAARAPQLKGRWLLISHQGIQTVAAHVSSLLRNHYFGRHEATRIHRIPGAGDFVFARCAVGLRDVCLTRPVLFSRKCGLPTKSTALRTHPQHTAGGLFLDQLCAYCTVCFVLPNDKRTISDVPVVGVRVGGRGLYCNGDTRGRRWVAGGIS
jgi:hypothetical protein